MQQEAQDLFQIQRGEGLEQSLKIFYSLRPEQLLTSWKINRELFLHIFSQLNSEKRSNIIFRFRTFAKKMGWCAVQQYILLGQLQAGHLASTKLQKYNLKTEEKSFLDRNGSFFTIIGIPVLFITSLLYITANATPTLDLAFSGNVSPISIQEDGITYQFSYNNSSPSRTNFHFQSPEVSSLVYRISITTITFLAGPYAIFLLWNWKIIFIFFRTCNDYTVLLFSSEQLIRNPLTINHYHRLSYQIDKGRLTHNTYTSVIEINPIEAAQMEEMKS